MSSSTFAVPQNSQPAAYYQYGPPQTPHDAYNMVADKVRASVETAMPRAFFDVPADAAAIFSTQQGKALKRPALDPPPPPVVRSNLEQEIYRKADQLRAQFPDIAGTVQTVTSWDMLYYYFDAQDLQIEGAPFLFYVINAISNQNDYDEGRQVLLKNWARSWIGSNYERIRGCPCDYDLTTLVTAEDKLSMTDCTPKDWAYLKGAMGNIRNEMQLQVEQSGSQRCGTQKQKQKGGQQQVQPMVQRNGHAQLQSQLQHGLQHGQGLQYNEHHAQQYGMQHNQRQHNLSSAQQYPVNKGQSQYQVLTNPTHPDLKYDATSGRIMEDHRNQAGTNNGQQYAFYPNAIHNWQERPRGYSNGGNNRNDRQQSRGNGNNSQNFSDRHNTYRKQNDRQYNSTNQNNRGTFDRRIIPNNSSRQSPRRNTGNMDQGQLPIYIRNPQRLSHQVPDEASYNADQHFFSDTTRHKFPNDARYYQKQQWQGTNNLRSSYFEGDPNVVLRVKSVNYYYNAGAKGHELEYTSRQVFVSGAGLDAFLSHELKDIFEQVGQVDFVSYLEGEQNVNPKANSFVAFRMEESVQKAITELNGSCLSDGRKIGVKLPGDRARSGSQSSYHSQEYRHYSGDYHRGSHSRMSSMSQRQFTSPNAPRSNSPLTAGFQAQLSPPAMGDMLSTVAQLNQKHEAVTGIPQSTPDRPVEKVSHNSEAATPSKSKGKVKKIGSVRGSRGPTPAPTPTKSRSQTNIHANALVDITNIDKISTRQPAIEGNIVKNPALVSPRGEKENALFKDAAGNEDALASITSVLHTGQKGTLTPERHELNVKKDKPLSFDTASASQANVNLFQQRKSVNGDSAPVEDDIVAVTGNRSTLSADFNFCLDNEENPNYSKCQLQSNSSSPVEPVPNTKAPGSAPNDNRECTGFQKSTKSTKKNKKKNKNKRGLIPEFNGQGPSPIDTIPLNGQASFRTFTTASSTGATNSTDSSMIDTSLSDSSFSKHIRGSKKSSSPRAGTPIPNRSDSETTLCNSPTKGDRGVSGVTKIESCNSSASPTPKQKSNGGHKPRKSSHAKNSSNQSTSSSGSLRKAPSKFSGSEKALKSTTVAAHCDVDESAKSTVEADSTSANSVIGKGMKHDDGHMISVQGQDCFNSIPGNKPRLDIEGPKVLSKVFPTAVPKVQSKFDLQKQAQRSPIASPDYNNAQWPALGNSKTSSPASIDRKPVASSAVRPMSERIGVVVPAIPLNMERRRQL